MKRLLPVLALTCAFAATADAQSAVLRGRVQSSAPNQFFLDATKITLTSSVVSLRQWSGADVVMKVTAVATSTTPVLHVDSITQDRRHLDMSPQPIGATGKFLVQSSPGATAAIFMDFAANGAFTPLPALGTWLLGPSPHLLTVGVTDATGQLAAKYAVPADQRLVGLLVSCQALVGDQGVWFLTNPDRQPVVR